MDLDSFDKLLVDELDIKPVKFPHSSGYCTSCKKAKHPQLEAAGSGHELCLSYSLNAEGLVAKDSFGATALHIAARKGTIQSLQCIVDVCSPVEAFRAQNKATPAHDAAGTGHLESLIFLIENTACTAHDRDKNQATPLHWAAQLGHTEVVDWLINDACAQPDVKNSAGLTPIHLAAAKNKLDTLKWLSNHLKNHYTDPQSYIDARALNGETPLYFAAQEGHLQVVMWLVDKMKSNISVRAHDGLAPVHAAAQEGHLECLKFLINSHKGSDILSADSATPGHFAASQGHVECLRWMLGNHILTGQEVDVYHSTIAHDAAEGGQLEILKLLYKRGADFSTKNEDQLTPLDIAVKNDHKACVTFLKNPDAVIKKTRRVISTHESSHSLSSEISSLPPSASEVAGITSQPPAASTQDPSSKLKQRKLTPMPPPVGTSVVEQKWVDKFHSQASNRKQPRIEEWVSSTVDQQNMKDAPTLEDDSESDLLAPVDSETQKKLTSEVMSKSDQTKLSDLQAHLQWVSQSSGASRPSESNIAEKEKERIFDEVVRSEQRQKQLDSIGIAQQEIESGNQQREKEESKRRKYREMREKEESDRIQSQQRLVAQKKEEERKFFEEQKYKYIIEEPSHFGTHTSGSKKKGGIIRRLSSLLKKNSSSPSERRGQPDGADSETGSLEPFSKLGLPHPDSSNYELYNLPAYRMNKKGREARKSESWVEIDESFRYEIELDFDTEIELMKHKLFCTQYNSDDSLASYEDENIVLLSLPSQYTITSDDNEGQAKERRVNRKAKKKKKQEIEPQMLDSGSSSDSEYTAFHKLTQDEMLYYLQFINRADNPSCQHPKAFTYLLNHFLIETPVPVNRQYYLDTLQMGPDPKQVIMNAFLAKFKNSQSSQDAGKIMPPVAFQTTDLKKRRAKQRDSSIDDFQRSNELEEIPLSFL